MKGKSNGAVGGATASVILSLLLLGCKENKPGATAEGPVKVTVEQQMNPNDFRVDHPERFLLLRAGWWKLKPGSATRSRRAKCC